MNLRPYTRSSLAMLSLVLLFRNAPASAQDTRLYLRADVGGLYAEDTTMSARGPDAAAHGTISFEPGGRLGCAGGYQLNDWLNAEASLGGEVAVLRPTLPRSGPNVFVVSGELADVPVMVGVMIHCPHMHRWNPYGGLSLGASEAIYATDGTGANGAGYAVGNGGSGIFTDTVFAYQAFIGMRYEFSDRMGLGFEYRFFGTEGPSWQVGSAAVSLDEQRMHSLSFMLDYRF